MDQCRGCGGSDSAAPLESHTLITLLAETVSRRMVVLCVGDELRGDDGAGPAVAKAITGLVPWGVLDAKNAPENFLPLIVERRPDCLLVIDAVHMGEPPGTVRLLETSDLANRGFGTHGPGLDVFFSSLAMVHPCRCAVLGIQPDRTAPGAPISASVQRAVDLVVDVLCRLAETS